jgi:hypothetical protein
MKKIISILTISLALIQLLFSQEFDWVGTVGGTNDDEVLSLTTDSAGNVYSTGTFYGTSDQDPSINQQFFTSNGLEDIFITKLDAFGNLIWTRQIGGGGRDFAEEIVIDDLGNVFVVGYFSGTADFDPDPINQFIMSGTGIGDRDLFLLKLDSNGNFVSAIQIGGFDFVEGNAIHIDSEYNFVIGGRFLNTIDFDPGASTFNLSAVSGYDLVVLKLDSAMDFIWARSFGGQTNAMLSIETDENDNIYTCGSFSGTGDFNSDSNGTLTLSTPNFASQYMFLHKIDKDGNFVWAFQTGSNSARDERLMDISITKSGYIYGIGNFGGTVDFDPSPSNTVNLVAAGVSGQTDVFVTKYDTSGALIWAKQIEGPNRDEGRAIATDPFDDIYITGFFQASADFNPDPSVPNILTGSGFPEIFIAKWTSSGSYVWAQGMGDSANDLGTTVDYCTNESVYLGGIFTGTLDFNSDPAVNSNTSSVPASSLSDGFIYKINQDFPCFPSQTSVIDSACQAYTSPSGNYIWTNSGTYQDTVIVNGGCDSVLSIDLTILNNTILRDTLIGCDSVFFSNTWFSSAQTIIDTFPIFGQCDLEIRTTLIINSSSFEPALSMTSCDSALINNNWYFTSQTVLDTFVNQQNCDSIVPTSLNISFSVFENIFDTILSTETYTLPSGLVVDEAGVYFDAFSTVGNCDSIIITNLFVEDNVGLRNNLDKQVNWSVYPNPSTDFFEIRLEKFNQQYQIEIYTQLGKVIFTSLKEAGNVHITIGNWSDGIYHLVLKDAKGQLFGTHKLVIRR